MSFEWPAALLTLLAIPLLLIWAWWARRRRRRAAVRISSVALVRSVLPGRTLWRRRVPVVLLILGIAVLSVGAARPQGKRTVASDSTTIMLALDVSGSMCSTDVAPNRLEAAQQAATQFIKTQADRRRIGLVAFAGAAGLLVPPTNDTDKLLAALNGLTTSRGTAIGQGILASIDAIAEIDPAVAPTGGDVGDDAPDGYAADAIVVLTDGANTQGVDPQTAAQQAADRHVRVYTIGFGTTTPAPLVCRNSQIDTGGFGGPGGGGGGGGGRTQLIDEPALRQVAATTGGSYYRAANAAQLQGVLAALPNLITVSKKRLDLAAWFAGVGGLLVAAAVMLSLSWNRVRQ